MNGLRHLGLIGWLAGRGGQRNCGSRGGFKVSRERLRRGCSEEEGSRFSVQDDEKIGYSGRLVAQRAGASGGQEQDKKWCLKTGWHGVLHGIEV